MRQNLKTTIAAVMSVLVLAGAPTLAAAGDATDSGPPKFDTFNKPDAEHAENADRSDYSTESGSASWADNAGSANWASQANEANSADYAKNADTVDGDHADDLGSGDVSCERVCIAEEDYRWGGFWHTRCVEYGYKCQ